MEILDAVDTVDDTEAAVFDDNDEVDRLEILMEVGLEAETDMKFLLKGLECVSIADVSLVLPASCLWTLLLAVLASAGPEDSWRLVPTLVPDQSRGGWSWTPPRAREPEVRMLLDVDILEEVARGDTLSLHLSSMLDMSRTTETECTLCCWSPDTFPESSHTTFHGVAPQHYTLLPPALVVLGQMCGQTIAACCTIATQRAQHSHHSPAQSSNGLVRIRTVRTLSLWRCRSPGQLTQHSLQYTPQFCIIHIMSPSHDTQWKVHLATLVRTDNISAHMSTAGYIYVNYPSNKKFPPHATPHLGPHTAGSGVS